MIKALRFIANQLAILTLAGAVIGYYFPAVFLIFGESILGMKAVLWMFAVTMFALGLVLEPDDLKTTLKQPARIGLGLLTQYTVMPALALLVTWLGDLPPAIALGLIIATSGARHRTREFEFPDR